MMRTSLFIAAALLTGCGLWGPPVPLFQASGRVVDAKGVAVPGVVLTDEQNSALSDELGRFSLPVFATTLVAVKPGYARASFTVTQGASAHVVLGASAVPARVAIDSRWVAGGLTGLNAALKRSASSVSAYPATGLSKLDVLFEITPGYLAASEQGAIARWVHAGGRLVLCGEWGGYPSQNIDTLQALANPAGITFNGGTVKVDAAASAAQWNSVSAISPTSLATLAAGSGDNNVYLFSTGALALSSPARTILTSAPTAYSVLGDSVARPGTQILAAVGASGEGKVWALADSSLWQDEESDGGGTPDVQRGANARLAGAMLRW